MSAELAFYTIALMAVMAFALIWILIEVFGRDLVVRRIRQVAMWPAIIVLYAILCILLVAARVCERVERWRRFVPCEHFTPGITHVLSADCGTSYFQGCDLIGAVCPFNGDKSRCGEYDAG